jgi:hypothetical protein
MAPTQIVFVVTLVPCRYCATVFVMAFPQNSQVGFWTAMAAYVGLLLGCGMKGV